MNIEKKLIKLNEINFEKESRGYAWIDCYTSFNNERVTQEQKAKELYLYLANWGMVVRKSFLLQYNWRIFTNVIKILEKEEYKELKDLDVRDSNIQKKIKNLIKLKKEINNNLLNYHAGNNITDTLVSKIILGTLGCTIAYDSKVVENLRENKIASAGFNDKSLEELAKFYNLNFERFENARKDIESKTESKCTQFKFLDLFLWIPETDSTSV